MNRQQKWRLDNPEKYRNQWLRNNKSIANRNSDLMRNYGIDLNEYNRMFQIQGGNCYICKLHQSQQKRAMSVDHDHKTNKVRKLLCRTCNSVLGLVSENSEILTAMINYLETHK